LAWDKNSDFYTCVSSFEFSAVESYKKKDTVIKIAAKLSAKDAIKQA